MANQTPRSRPARAAKTAKNTGGIDDIINRNLPAAGHTPHRYDLSIFQSLRRIIRATDIYSRRLRVTHDLTAPQLICLLSIVQDGPLTATLLAERVHVGASTVVGILDRLEKKGLVTRTRSDKDRRVIEVHPTARGRRLARHAPSPLQDNLARSLEGLPAKDQRAIARSLEKLVALMELADVDAAPILETGDLNN